MIFTSVNEHKFFKMLEAAETFSSLTDDIILVYNKTFTNVKLCLYDVANKRPLAFITGYNLEENVWQLDRIASEKGWGPLVNDMFIMFMSPDPVQPSTTIKPDALNIWKYYYDRRSDVTKVPLLPGHPSYATSYVDAENTPEITDAEDLRIINTLYTMEPTADFKRLRAHSDIMMKDLKLNKRSILKQGMDLFFAKYGAHAKAA